MEKTIAGYLQKPSFGWLPPTSKDKEVLEEDSEQRPPGAPGVSQAANPVSTSHPSKHPEGDA